MFALGTWLVVIGAVQYGLMTAVSVTTVAAFEAVGAILVIGLAEVVKRRRVTNA